MIHDKLTIYLGGMIIGYGLITPVHLDGDPVPVVAGTDLLVREPEKQNSINITHHISFRMIV